MPEIMQLTNEAKEEDLCPAGDGGTLGLVNDEACGLECSLHSDHHCRRANKEERALYYKRFEEEKRKRKKL